MHSFQKLMNNNTHPIEVALVACLFLLEAIAWVINELTGGHKQQAQVTTETASQQQQQQQPPWRRQSSPFIQPLFTELQQLTVKQLRVITGQKSSRLRKHQLIQLAYGF